MNDIKIDCIIVNWNSGIQLFNAIKSIHKNHANLISSIIIVDNASNDDSLHRINFLMDDVFPIQIIQNTKNKGFGAACNQGVKLSNSEFLLFLNPDTELFANSLSAPLSYMQDKANTDVGICGIQLIDETGSISRTCARFPTVGMYIVQAFGLNKLPWLKGKGHHMSDWDHACTSKVDHVIGAFYLIRKSLFESLHGFDERFFVYLEDLDLSFRAHQAGWSTAYLTEAQAFHAGGGTSSQVKAHRLFYSLRSRLLYGFKYFSSLQAWVLMTVTLLVEPVSRSVFSLMRGGFADLHNTLKGYGMLWRAIPAILKSKEL